MQSRNNADRGYSLLQVAEGAMFEITSIIQRLNTLAMQAANETLTNSDRQLIQAEVNELVAEIDRMASAVTFNGIPLLKGSTIVGSGSIGIQVGYNAVSNIGINLLTMTSASLGLTNLDLTSVANAQAAISSLSSTLSSAVKQYAKIGALQNRVGYASDFLDVQKLHFTSALSAIEDTDFAEELTKYSQKKIMVETGINMLAQSNLMMEKVLNLLELKK
ncbi:MAG TPA: flagellin, partial [bacterium]|nr:flagellin [bacterium]